MKTTNESDPKKRCQAEYHEEQPIRLAGSVLGKRRHIGAFFRNSEEEYDVLLPFIQDGFERGEKAFHVVNPTEIESHTKRLRSVGIDVGEAERNGQYHLGDWDEFYFPEGRFDQDYMLNTWKDLLDMTGLNGLTRTRLIAHMEWATEDRDGVSDLLEYEARFNKVHGECGDPVICVYDLTKFSSDIVLDALRTHPMVIIGGLLQENPLYAPPEEFLREYLGRRLTRPPGN